jgi:hypothetical protein
MSKSTPDDLAVTFCSLARSRSGVREVDHVVGIATS